jgi:hypothetical protein
LFAHPLHLPDLSDRLLELFHARPVVLDVVFLDFLDVMVSLGVVHSFGTVSHTGVSLSGRSTILPEVSQDAKGSELTTSTQSPAAGTVREERRP